MTPRKRQPQDDSQRPAAQSPRTQDEISRDWRIGFHRAMVDTVLRLGSPRKPGEGWQLFYGWEDYGNYDERRAAIHEKGIDYDKTKVEEADWQEFMGTFHEGDNTVYGVDMKLVLFDGSEQWWRYGRRLSEFLMEVVRYEE